MLAMTGTAAQIGTIAGAADALARRLQGTAGSGKGTTEATTGTTAAPWDDPTRARLTLEHARVDALVGLCERALDDPGATSTARPRHTAEVLIHLPTLLGLADSPGYLPGYGPIPPVLARELASDARWRRLVTDPVTGHLLDYGTTVYSPPARLAAYVRAVARTCRAPGCDRDAQRCDLDHRHPFRRRPDGKPAVTRGGPVASEHPDHTECDGCTSAHNLDPYCRWHHLLKTHHGFHVARGSQAECTVTTPSGRRYTTRPHDYRPDG